MPKKSINNKKIKKQTKKKNVPPKSTNSNKLRVVPNAVKIPTATIPPMVNKPSRVSIHEAICQITDPFCFKAKGTKWPDGQGGATMTMQIRNHLTFSTLANGGNLVYLTPNLPYGYFLAASVAAGVYTMNATYASSISGTNFGTWVNTYRVVSTGIIVRNMLPALTASGYIIVSRQTSLPAVSSTENSGLTLGAESNTFPLHAGSENAFIHKPVGSAARSFVAQSTTTTNLSNWDVIKLEVVGGPASTTSVIDVEVVYNIEFTLPESQLNVHQFIKNDRPNAPKAVEASNLVLNRVSDSISNTATTIGNSILSHAESAVEDIFSSAVAFLGL